ncbi:hypothetical protein ABZ814_13490 [Micromonospora musae]|uniref:hypothetical protein n=1 Tax=Micromonospora musae TaxID=1894970 RepID=UPI0033F62768
MTQPAGPSPGLSPYAADADLEARIGRSLTEAEAARAAALIADASALIRGYTRQDFTFYADDVLVLRPVGSHLRLPQRPVAAVTAVVALSGTEAIPDWTVPPGCWQWDGADIVEVWPPDRSVWVSLPEWAYTTCGPDTYRVTYSHGYDEVPADVTAVCCRMVLAVLLAPTMTEGLVQERIGQYSYQYGQQLGAGSPGATVRMSEADRDDLKRYRRTAGTIQTRVR